MSYGGSGSHTGADQPSIERRSPAGDCSPFANVLRSQCFSPTSRVYCKPSYAWSKAFANAALVICRPSPDPPAPSVADLAQRYLVEHVEVRGKPRTIRSRRWLVQKFVLPKLGKLTSDEVERKHMYRDEVIDA